MNFKAMNMKKGLRRFWIVGSMFWFLYPLFPPVGYVFGLELSPHYGINLKNVIVYNVLSQIIWWTIFFLGFWVVRGFIDDDDTKAGF